MINCRLLMDKYIYQQRKLYHNFIDFKNVVDRVCHNGIWHTVTAIGIHIELINIIKKNYIILQQALFY